MQKDKHTYSLPLERLLTRLEHAGFTIHADTRIKTLKLLQQLGDKYMDDPNGIKRILRPLLAKDADQQEKFDQIFDRVYPEGEGISKAGDTKNDLQPDSIEMEQAQAVKKHRIWAYGVGMLLMVVLFVGIKYSISTDDHLLDEVKNEVSNEETDFVEPELNISQKDSLKQSLFNEFNPLGSWMPEIKLNVESAFAEEETELSVLFGPGRSNMGWVIGKDTLSAIGPRVFYTFPNAGFYEISIFHSGGLSEGPYSRSFQVLVHKPKTYFQEIQEAEFSRLERKQLSAKIFIFFLFFLTISLVEVYVSLFKRSYYDRILTKKFIPDSDAPYEVPFDIDSKKLITQPEFFDLAEALRKRQEEGELKLNIPATLTATIRSGGYPNFQYQPMATAVGHLVLVDKSSSDEQQATMFVEIMELLAKEGINLEVYTFRSDPRICMNELHPEGESLEALSMRHHKHRLTIFGKGSYLVNPATKTLQPWVENAFAAWSSISWLTPVAPENWTIREEALAGFFNLLPAEVDGQLNLVEAMLETRDPQYDSLKDKNLVTSEPAFSLDDFDFEDPTELRHYLGDAVFEWLAATAVYPRPNWKMVLEVGKGLSHAGSEGILIRDKNSETPVSLGNLLKLSRIPWIHTGNLSESLRQKLMSEGEPETAEVAREAVLEVLASEDLPEGSFEWHQREILEAYQKENKKEDAHAQRQLRFLWKHNLLDFQAQKSAENTFEPTFLEKVVQSRFVETLRPVLTMPAIAGLVMICVMVFSAYQVSQHTDEVLFKQAFSPYQMYVPSLENDRDFMEIKENYDQGNYEKAAELLSAYSDQKGKFPDFFSEFYLRNISLARGRYEEAFRNYGNSRFDYAGLYEVAEWYEALSHLAFGYSDEALKRTRDIAITSGHPFQGEAMKLLRESRSVWRLGR